MEGIKTKIFFSEVMNKNEKVRTIEFFHEENDIWFGHFLFCM